MFFSFPTISIFSCDSVQRTLQDNFIGSELGDPSSLDIRYAFGDGEELSIPGMGFTLPLDSPIPAPVRIK